MIVAHEHGPGPLSRDRLSLFYIFGDIFRQAAKFVQVDIAAG